MTGIRPISPRVAPGQSFAPKDVTFRPRDDEVFANEFGVAADGTDQTVNLGRALTAAAARGKTLVIPPGTYRCVDVPVPAGAGLRGFGGRSILRRPSTGAGGLSNVLRVAGSNVTISDLDLDGNVAGGSMADARGVIDMGSTVNYQNVTIERCGIRDAAQSGIRLRSCLGGVRIRDCQIVGYVRTGVQVTSGSGADINGIAVYGCEISSTTNNATGILIRGTDDGTTRFANRVRVENNEVVMPFFDGGLCIEVWARDAAIIGNVMQGARFGISRGFGERGTIMGNVIYQPTAYGIEASSGPTAQYVTVVGNTVHCNHVTGFGIGAQFCDWLKIHDNTITSPQTRGITVSSCPVVSVCGNTVQSDATTDTVSYGIHVASGSEAVVNSNMVDGTTPNAGLADNGISIENTPDFTLVGNRVKNHTNGIRLISAAAALAGTVVGNHLDGNTDPYLESLSGGATTTDVVFGSNRPTIP